MAQERRGPYFSFGRFTKITSLAVQQAIPGTWLGAEGTEADPG
jgi:hypothetical protein